MPKGKFFKKLLWADISIKLTNICLWHYIRRGCKLCTGAINNVVSQATLSTYNSFCWVFHYCLAFEEFTQHTVPQHTMRWFSHYWTGDGFQMPSKFSNYCGFQPHITSLIQWKSGHWWVNDTYSSSQQCCPINILRFPLVRKAEVSKVM